jgi:integrase
LRFIVIDMPKNEVRIYNSKAVIYQNDYDVWQFRIWLADEDKYFRQSLRTKDKAKAIADAEEMYEDIKYMKRRGKKIYSISIKQAVAMYIEDKAKYVGIDGANGIVEGRLGTIKAHMKHFLEYVHKDAKVKDLGINTLLSYDREGETIDYELFRKRKGIADSTIRNEVASINACMTFLHEHTEALSDISAFKVPKIQSRKYDDSGEEIRRQTFTSEEWQTFYVAMRSYSAKKNNPSIEEYYEKQLARHFLLVMANSGFRNGELRQLKWKNVTVERHVDSKQKPYSLARIRVEAQTSKVRIPRTLYANCGKYIERWQKIQKECAVKTSEEDFVFSVDGSEFSNRRLNHHFNNIMKMTNIAYDRRNDLVIYSLRHMFITNMSLSGASFDSIAHHCGTSIQQIEKVYKHVSDDEKRTFATKRYMNINGNIVAMSDAYGD